MESTPLMKDEVCTLESDCLVCVVVLCLVVYCLLRSSFLIKHVHCVHTCSVTVYVHVLQALYL